MKKLTFLRSMGSLGVVGVVLLAAGGAHAQGALPVDECAGGGGAIPPPNPDVAEPGFGVVFVTSPPSGSVDVPRNVQIRLGGELAGLVSEPPQTRLELYENDGERVPFTLRGGLVELAEPLAANRTFTVRAVPTDAHPCPDCFGPQESVFTTSDVIDTEPPTLTAAVDAQLFVMPSTEEAQKCGIFVNQTHFAVLRIDAGVRDVWLSFSGRAPGEPIRALTETYATGQEIALSTALDPQLPLALGDELFFAATPRDLAGNVGRATTVRVRARSFRDQNLPPSALSDLSCELPGAPTVHAPASLPQNGLLHTDFPFESVPLALRADDGSTIPLVADSDSDGGQVLRPSLPPPAGVEHVVTGLPCPQCACAGCTAEGVDLARVTFTADTDRGAPDAPQVIELREDASPAVSTEQCGPDRAALVVVLEPGVDDVTAPLDLRYDATIRFADQPPQRLATGVRPFERADGQVAVRLDMSRFGRLLGRDASISLIAIDAAGNTSAADIDLGSDEESGCSAAGVNASAGLLSLLLLALRRRRR